MKAKLIEEPRILKLLSIARLNALYSCPYFAHAMTALTYFSVEGLGTAAIDRRWRLYVDPEIIQRWSTSELSGVLIHELNHVLRGHHLRNRDGNALWNLACDLEVNDDLSTAAIQLPTGSVHPSDFGLAVGETAEEYLRCLENSYKLYEKEHKGSPIETEDCRCGSGATGLPESFELDSEDSGVDPYRAEILRRKVAEAVSRERIGTVPGGLRRWAEAMVRPISWHSHLRREIRKSIQMCSGQVDYSWKRLSRRHTGAIRLPRMVARKLNVACIIDTSGSMQSKDIDFAISEVVAMSSLSLVNEIQVIACDTEATILGRLRLKHGMSVELPGGGGTDLETAFRCLSGKRSRCPEIVVIITDGENYWSSTRPTSIRDSRIIAVTPRDARQTPKWISQVRIESWSR